MPDSDKDLLIGTTLGHYRIVEKLGAGGMGEVYAADDTKLNRQVAIKVLSPSVADNPERLQRFHREAQAVAALNHPNIVTLYSVEEEDETRFLTMEKVEGETLDHEIPRGGMKLSRFFQLAIPMTEALSVAHERGIIHRDLKPGNIMVTADGRVKILDFGLAKLQDPADENDGSYSTTTQALTQEGSILGTVAFMSPEQLQGKSPDTRSDLFSLGIVLYQMATGERPFEGESPADLISCILRDDPPPVSDVKVSLPSHLGRILERCLEKDPEQRYQTAESLRSDLVNLKQQLDSGTLGSPVSRTPPPVPDRGSWRWPLAAVIAVMLAATGWAFLSRSDPPPPPPPAEPATFAQTTIEIQPLENLGPEAAEPFVNGLTAEVTAQLSDMDNVGVLLADSAPGAGEGEVPPEADYVLGGAVQWGETDEASQRLRINFDLYRKRDGLLVWSERYDRRSEDLFQTQTDIARLLTRKLALSVLDYQVDDLDLDLAGYEPPRLLDEAPAAPDPAARASTRTAPATQVAVSPVQDEAVVTPAPTTQTLPDFIELEVILTSALPRGVVTLFEDNDRILQEPFRFKGKAKPPFIVELHTRIAADAVKLKLYVAPRGKPAAVLILRSRAVPGMTTRTLLLELTEDGSLSGDFADVTGGP